MGSIASERYSGISCHTCVAYSKTDLILYVYTLSMSSGMTTARFNKLTKSVQSLSRLGNYIFNVSVPFKVIA